ncbi:50S ribosomal protein L6 [Tistrella mobilis]|jgi:large subunit ribosomal protein L6|uniref:Large ribosomal subunit protein uL6 n=1 Tax=Tistrella mobilis (strain KA081020-065) TaxID=1110502 RepID=I3TNW7_TISMK|nr:50S ribosomal protein L6 [Tistrella mobilis]AFK54455.1 large subunit ribosomal protein L6 [Tistrella mobilis KA081020-065]MAM75799.1 50S ribosomal protein L6 [Tistrella sp.]|tara:strand:+ start:23 stop:556 length:534 start_codon:yes stop_codon:yes gene_type:complete
MSRIGKNPVAVPQGVEVAVDGNTVRVKGKLGALERTLPSDVNVALEDGKVVVAPANDERRGRAMWGLSRTLVANMVKGVSEGFTVKLDINGVGYRAAVDGKLLTLQLGYSHDIKYAVPADIEIKAEKPTALAISGIDKQRVGQIAAEIRSFRSPEPYKGKGVKYEDEIIVRKEGKKK